MYSYAEGDEEWRDEWLRVQPDFKVDGALRDIYVFDITITEWQAVWESLRDWIPTPIFMRGDTAAPMPQSIAELFYIRDDSWPRLIISSGAVALICHFFDVSEIEFDCDPREVNSLHDYAAIMRFMRHLHNITGRSVLLTYENMQDEEIASYP